MHHEFVLIPDWTVAIQLGLFLASFFSLHFLVFKPFQALLHARHEKTTGLKEKALAAEEKSAKIKQEYDLFMKGERKVISASLEEARRQTADEERTIIQTVRDEVANELGVLRTNVAKEAASARAELLKQIPEYSSLIASKLTGMKVKVTGVKIENKEGPASDQRLL